MLKICSLGTEPSFGLICTLSFLMAYLFAIFILIRNSSKAPTWELKGIEILMWQFIWRMDLAPQSEFGL